MLTEIEYEQLWNEHFYGTRGLEAQPMPPYHEYVSAENMLEDYLDIFRGVNTRNTRNTQNNGYDEHPFFDGDNTKLTKKPCIKYIMIGEARPPENCSVFNDCLPINGDTKNSYFYNIKHVNVIQPWLNAPRLAWECPTFKPCPSNKIETLLCLASKGVLLLDLFPFAIRYSTNFRDSLNILGSTRNFWDDASNPYNIQKRIANINNLLSENWDLGMVAPGKISGFIVSPINRFPTIATPTIGIHPINFRDILPDPTRCSSCAAALGYNQWRKIAIAQQAPSVALLGICFNI